MNLDQAQSDANAASAAYAALTPTQTLRNVTSNVTLTGNGGINVIGVQSLDLTRKTLTLSGGAERRIRHQRRSRLHPGP